MIIMIMMIVVTIVKMMMNTGIIIFPYIEFIYSDADICLNRGENKGLSEGRKLF